MTDDEKIRQTAENCIKDLEEMKAEAETYGLYFRTRALADALEVIRESFKDLL